MKRRTLEKIKPIFEIHKVLKCHHFETVGLLRRCVGCGALEHDFSTEWSTYGTPPPSGWNNCFIDGKKRISQSKWESIKRGKWRPSIERRGEI
jgi:hypothetical protein